MGSDKKFAPLSFDNWAPFSYKRAIRDKNTAGLDWMAPTWVGDERRRHQAYAMLQGYRDNIARHFSPFYSDDERQALDKRREYGDANLLLETARSKMMGDQQTIVVAGAEKYDEAAEDNTPEATAANERQDELRQWGEEDRFLTKMTETERNAVDLGDGVYTLSWVEDKRRPVLLPWEPDCYFPVLDSVPRGEYPTKVHLAWELTDDEARAKYREAVTVIHRITFELVDVEEVGLTPYAVPYETELVTEVCLMTEAEFKTTKGARSVDDLEEASAIYMLDDEDQPVDRKPLGIDFLPVIHIPNTVAELTHYGRSVLTPVLQLCDDIHSVDSDIQASSDLTGNPSYVFKGGNPAENREVGPGFSFNVPENGGIEVISGREAIEGLMNHRDGLLDRLAVNSRITAAAQGRINPEKLQAGVILQLSFGPLTSLVDEMRLARKDKYRLLFKFVQRYMLINGEWQGEVHEADLAFGSYLPSDRSAMVTDVCAAYGAKLISAETAIRMLIEVGFPIDDIAEELQKIDARDYEGAVQLLDATGSDEAVENMLGVKIERPSAQEQATALINQNAVPSQEPPVNNSPQDE
jgi:hypothetical protein